MHKLPEKPKKTEQKLIPKVVSKPKTKASYFIEKHRDRITEIRDRIIGTAKSHDRLKLANAISRAVLGDPEIKAELSILFKEDRAAYRDAIVNIKYILFPRIEAILKEENR